MACLHVIAIRQKGVTISAGMIRDKTEISASRTDEGLVLSPSLSSEGLNVGAARSGMRMTASAKMVCTLHTPRYLKVNPQEVAWVDEYTDFTYYVQSNTNWNVE